MAVNVLSAVRRVAPRARVRLSEKQWIIQIHAVE